MDDQPMMCRKRPLARPLHRGFTAIELMVVVSILAILAALAAPSFKPLMDQWRVRQAVETLRSTLYYARSEAIRRGGGVVVQKLPNGTNGCTNAINGADWGCGWTVCVDADGNNNCGDAGDTELQRYDTPTKVEISRTDGASSFSLNRWGAVTGPYVGFNLVPQNESISNPAVRGLCMSSAGRIRVIPMEDVPCTD